MTATPSSSTLKQLVATQFASRPTFRDVLSQQVFTVVGKHFPERASTLVDHGTLEPYTLLRPDAKGKERPEPFLKVMLEAYQQGLDVAFGAEDWLQLERYDQAYLSAYFERLNGAKDDRDDGLARMPLAGLNADLNAVLASLLSEFQQAQLGFWNQDDGVATDTTGISRHGWMRQVLRLALMGNVAAAGLEDDEQACVYEVLLGMPAGPSVSAIELSYRVGEASFGQLLPDLLIEAERDERSLLLRCSPSGHIQAFESLQAFAEHLRDELLSAVQFDRLAWRRRTFAGDAWLQQSGMLLDKLLDEVERLRLSSIADSESLELAMSALTDPSRYFFNDTLFDSGAPPAALPTWLMQASDADRFEYQVAMLDLAISQALARGRSSLEGVEDLQGYAARRLREELLADYPAEANYFPDDLLLQVSVPDPATDKELPVVLQAMGGMTLTQFAIQRLDGLTDAVVTGITHRNEQLIMPWMTPVYATGLVERIDIGAVYPAHVAALLDEPGERPARIELFAREWRSALLFDSLRAKVEGLLDAPCWLALAEFCRSGRDLKANVDLAPLAFNAHQSPLQRDQAGCMYVITLAEPKAVLLYRPLYRQQPLLRYADNAGLMAALTEAGELQDSVLDWLPSSAFSVYANGGFLEPHLRRVIFDTSIWPAPAKPVRLALVPYLADIDAQLYQDKRQTLMQMAQRDSISNAEYRWGVAKRFGWLLFDLVAPLLPGPLGKVAWVASMLAPLLAQPQARPAEGASTLLAVDLAVNLVMALLNTRLPSAGELAEPSAGRFALAAPVWRKPFQLPAAPVAVVHEPLDLALEERAGHAALGHGWGDGPLTQRTALAPYRAQVDLTAAQYGNRLYLLDERFYAVVHGETYEVGHDEAGRRILGPTGEWGPWLFDDGSRLRVRSDGFAWGGQSGKGAQAKTARDQRRFDQLASGMTQMFSEIEVNRQPLDVSFNNETESYRQLTELYQLRARAAENDAGLPEEQLRRMLLLYDQKSSAKLAEYHQARQAYVDGLQLNIQRYKTILELTDAQLDLQKRRNVVTSQNVEALLAMRETARVGVARNAWGGYFRLFAMADYPGLVKLESTAGRAELRARLRELVVLQDKLIETSALLDEFIPLIPQDTTIAVLDGSPQLMSQGKKDRVSTTVNLLLMQAQFYRILALNTELEGSRQVLLRYKMELLGPHLLYASLAHVEVQRRNLTGTTRAEVLQSAWDEYSASLINCVDIKREGGALVDLSTLERFAQVMQRLKDDAGARLADLDGQEQGPNAYASSEVAREVAYLGNGQIVVGDRVTIDGKTMLEIRNLTTGEVAKRFELIGEAWVDPALQATVPDTSGEQTVQAEVQQRLLAQAAAVLDDDARVQETATEFVAKQVNHRVVQRLIDEHVAKLQALAAELVGNTGTTADQLREQLAAWAHRRRQLLVRLYSQTPFPDAQGLRYLHQQQLLKIDYTGQRHVYRDGSFDDYEIRLLKNPGDTRGKLIWVAHFHYAQQDSPATEFILGHLKTAKQRGYGKAEEAQLAKVGQWVHRGPLVLAQVWDIIPFT
ncbi:hypothetical protein [Pseudomonas putida]